MSIETRGITLVEVLLSVAILVILGTVGFISYGGYQRKVELDAVTRDILVTLREAQGKAMTGQDDKSWGVHFDANPTNTYVLYRDDGSGYAAATEKRTSYISSYIKISTVSIQGGGTEILFAKRTGATTTYGSGASNAAVRVQDINDSSKYHDITVTAQGKIDTQ